MPEDEDVIAIILSGFFWHVFLKMKIPLGLFSRVGRPHEISGQAFWSQSQNFESGAVPKKLALRFGVASQPEKITPVVSSSSQKGV